MKEHPDVKGETLKDDFVSEAVVTFCTYISNSICFPVDVDCAKERKTDRNVLKSIYEKIQLIKICYKCLNEMPAPKMTLDINNIKYNNKSEERLRLNYTCIDCATVGHTSYIPSLRACSNCIETGHICRKLAVYVITLDYEEGNKQAMMEIMRTKESRTIDPDFLLLVPMPDVMHVGKSLKCSFANCFFMLSGYRSVLSLIRSLPKYGDNDIKENIQRLLKSENVRNRDRMTVDPVIRITSPEGGKVLVSVDHTVCTIVSEKMRL